MADFAWHAISASGEQVRGTFQASSVAAVQKHLRAQKLTPVRIVDAADAAALMPAGAGKAASKAVSAAPIAQAKAGDTTVIVIGKLRSRRWVDANGVEHEQLQIRASAVGHDLTGGCSKF